MCRTRSDERCDFATRIGKVQGLPRVWRPRLFPEVARRNAALLKVCLKMNGFNDVGQLVLVREGKVK